MINHSDCATCRTTPMIPVKYHCDLCMEKERSDYWKLKNELIEKEEVITKLRRDLKEKEKSISDLMQPRLIT